MRIAKKTHYGLQLLMHLSARPDEWYSLTRLSQELQLPLSFLKHIAAALKREQILESQGGMHGGYRLHRPLKDITLSMVFASLGEVVKLTPCATPDCTHTRCLTGPFWVTVTDRLTSAFQQTTLEVIKGTMTRPS